MKSVTAVHVLQFQVHILLIFFTPLFVAFDMQRSSIWMAPIACFSLVYFIRLFSQSKTAHTIFHSVCNSIHWNGLSLPCVCVMSEGIVQSGYGMKEYR